MKITSTLSRFSKIQSNARTALRPLTPIIALALLVLAIPVLTADAAPQKSPTKIEFAQSLKGQVETSGGTPRTGKNPAVQSQTSLTVAASTPNSGIGSRVDKPAANITGTNRQLKASDVLPDTKKTGISVAGCLQDYGTPGVQCVPSAASKDTRVSCDAIRTIFPKGVAITGIDRLGLSTGKKIACGA